MPSYAAGASPFGFPITVKETGLRTQLVQYLHQEGIDTRPLFCGNVTRQPYMQGRKYKVSGSLFNSDKILEDSFWIGCHPALTTEQLDYACSKIEAFFGVFA